MIAIVKTNNWVTTPTIMDAQDRDRRCGTWQL